MRSPKLMLILVAGILAMSGSSSAQADAAKDFLKQIKLPTGFKISTYAANVPGARQMCLAPDGVLFVGTKQEKGSVYAVIDKDKDGKADEVIAVAQDLFMPNGVAFRKGALYVAEVNRILR